MESASEARVPRVASSVYVGGGPARSMVLYAGAAAVRCGWVRPGLGTCVAITARAAGLPSSLRALAVRAICVALKLLMDF